MGVAVRLRGIGADIVIPLIANLKPVYLFGMSPRA
jgi:hypothetical protein